MHVCYVEKKKWFYSLAVLDLTENVNSKLQEGKITTSSAGLLKDKCFSDKGRKRVSFVISYVEKFGLQFSSSSFVIIFNRSQT